MSRIGTWFRRAKYHLKHDFLTVENMVLFFAIVLCLVWTYLSITAMSRHWELSEKLAAEKKELELINVEIEAAELENEYYQSNEYQELLARRYLDKQMAGEKMVVMPENSEEAKSKHIEVAEEVKEKQYSNFEKWMKYLFRSY